MRRWLAENETGLPMAVKAMISLALGLLTALALSTTLWAQGPTLTTISDTVYRADGTPASGTVLISWPSFQTAEGNAVAAGNLSVTIGPLGALVAQLVPNVGASPAGTYYVVVLQLDDGTVRTEYWAVPTTSPTTIAAVLTTPGTGLGNLAATQQYVNAAVAPLAIDATVVHLAESETITGTKQFGVPPSFPAPVGANEAANKGYVDAAVANVGAGAYVPVAGGTMTGPLTLPGDPTAPNQAADRNYIDNGLAVKADLISGTVPTGELGAGVASSATCLTGNSTWGSCGSGAPVGITYATTALNWTQTNSNPLTGGSQATVTLTPCPTGIDTTSGAGYQVLVSGGGKSEAVNVVSAAGGCTSGAGSGTITFTPVYSYAAGYTIGSASSGIQETLNACGGTSAAISQNGGCNVTLPGNGLGPLHTGGNYSANTYWVYGTIFVHTNAAVMSGYGATLYCVGRGACIQTGDRVNSNDFTDITLSGITFANPINWSTSGNASYVGLQITNTAVTSNFATITTAAAHGFHPGDMVTILFTDNPAYWGDAVVTDCGSGTTSAPCTSSSTTFRYAHPKSGGSIASQATPGVVALAYTAVLDNAANTHLSDLATGAIGSWGQFNNVFDFWDDENATVEHFNNNATQLNANANWTSSYIFSGGASNLGASQQLAPVITVRDSTITANGANCATVYNSNGLYFENTVCQAQGLWEVNAGNVTGNYQGAYIKNIYSEGAPLNPGSPVHSPFPGLGSAGLIAQPSSGAANFQIRGSGGTTGTPPSGGSGSTGYSYYIVAHDGSARTSPMLALNWNSTGSDSPVVRWARVANGADSVTYDVLRMAYAGGVGATYPYNGGCNGGAGGQCGSIVTGLSQSSACGNTLVCTYTDSGPAASTSTYTIAQATYSGPLNFWPGAIVSVSKTVGTDIDEYNVTGVGLNGNPIEIASQCPNAGGTSAGGYIQCLNSITTANNSIPNQTGALLTDGPEVGNGMTLTKGRLNFSSTPGALISAHHIVTLLDSQPALTQSTWGYRPPASANDTWIGTDISGSVYPSAGQLAFGAPVSITNYIAQTGDGIHANWLERLSASLKEFNVPTKFDQGITLAGLSNGCLNVSSGVVGSTGSPCGSGSGGGDVSSVFGRTGTVVANNGDYSVSQVTGAAVDAAVVHLANAETIGGAKTFTSNITISGNLLLPQANGYVPAVGGIGLDTAAGLPVVNIGGTTQQIALTSSNISGQAGTALALAVVPTQCSGSFATGIAANGNANCSTPDTIQLPETTQPAGIPNWGIFWFDAATHTPRVIDNNGQAVQLGLTNLFNSDPGGDAADNIEERNGSNAENLRVYSSYTNNTTWQRASLGFDTADNYAVVRSENAISASAPGLGLWIGSGLKWVVDATGNLKPWTDNTFNLGSDSGNAAKSIFAKTSFDSVLYGRNDFEIPNDGTTGTLLNQLAMFNSNNPSQAVVASTSATNSAIGVVQGGAGKSGNAVITWHGYAYCIFDNATAAGDTVIASTTTAGDCHDTGSGAQPAAELIGYVDVSNTVSGQTNGMRVSLQGPQSGGGSVASVFGRTGAVTAASGDYSVSQVTGAATDSAVVHLAGAETITGAKTFSSNITLTGNLNVAGNINQTGTGPTQWSGVEWAGTTVTVPSGMNFSLGLGSDNTFRCQLSSGASCMPSGGGMVYPGAGISNSTGSGWAASYGTSGTGTTLALTASPVFTGAPVVPGYVPTGTTVNGHALSANVVVSASDVTTGILPAAQLPAPSCSWITVPTQSGSGNAFSGTSKAIVWGVYNPYPCVSNNVAYVVGAADNSSNNYALGLYSGTSSGTGTLVATTASTAGTTFAPSSGIKHIAWNASNITVPAGRIYIALTSNCSSACAALLGTPGTGVTWAANVQVSVATGGAALPATVTLPADSFSSGASIPSLIVY